MTRFLLIACFALSTFAQTTPVLIPVFYNGPGQRGSQWFTAVNYTYLGSEAIQGRGVRVLDRTCPIPGGMRELRDRAAVVRLGGWSGVGERLRLRTTLRVYSPDAILNRSVLVELSDWGSTTALASKVVRLEISDPPGAATPLRPAFAQLDLQREFPNVVAGAVTVRVVPLPTVPDAPPQFSVSRIWAFATAVRNDNNEVAVYSPR